MKEIAFLVLVQAWEQKTPEEVGLSRARLDELRAFVKGRGCVVRQGRLAYSWGDVAKSSDVASAFKPVLSTLLLIAVQEGKIKSVDARLSELEPRLTGKNAKITWRHLASQTSGYGLDEEPGRAYSYNDYALALYYDTLVDKVFKEHGSAVLKSRLGDVLGFEDAHTFEAFGPKDRPGRLALSVRDFARVGLLYLRGGKWKDRQVVRPDLLKMAISSPLGVDTPLASGREGEMIPGQRTIGGSKNITPVGPGHYSFNWWLNHTDAQGRRLYVDAPADAVVASGHGGQRVLWVIPSLDLLVCWNDSPIKDHDKTPGNPDAMNNRAARLIVQSVGGTRLGIKDADFTINDKPTFLLGVSYYAGLGASDATLKADLDDMQKFGFNWLRVWATWAAFGNDVSAVDEEGKPREPFLGKLKALVAECDRRGMVVDVTLSRENGISGGPRLQTLEVHKRAVETVVTALKEHRNWYLDLANERNIEDKRFIWFGDLRSLRVRAKELMPDLLVTASHAGDLEREDVKMYLMGVAGIGVEADFLSPHRPRNDASPRETFGKTAQVFTWTRHWLDKLVPVHYQEPFRRGFGKWSPKAEDFLKDLQAARGSGAAGWCFHNGDERDKADGVPRRSFDLREKRLFDQLDGEERKFLQALKP